MTYHTEHRIWCDSSERRTPKNMFAASCDSTITTNKGSMDDLKREAEVKGWRLRQDKQLCPLCVTRAIQAKRKAATDV